MAYCLWADYYYLCLIPFFFSLIIDGIYILNYFHCMLSLLVIIYFVVFTIYSSANSRCSMMLSLIIWMLYVAITIFRMTYINVAKINFLFAIINL